MIETPPARRRNKEHSIAQEIIRDFRPSLSTTKEQITILIILATPTNEVQRNGSITTPAYRNRYTAYIYTLIFPPVSLKINTKHIITRGFQYCGKRSSFTWEEK